MNVTVLTGEQRRQRGLVLYRQIMAIEPPDPATPRGAALVDFVFAEIWSRPGLPRRDRRVITLTCAADAGARRMVAEHLYAALATGEFSVAELEDFVLHFAVYCGWPKAEALEEILTAQSARLAATGDHASSRPVPQPPTRVARIRDGEEKFRAVNCCEAPPRTAPYYDDGVLNFVFAEVWTRPGLTRRDRRLISLACAGLGEATDPVRSHVYSAMKSGDLNYAEMLEIVLQFAAHAGWPKAQFLQQCVDEMHALIDAEESART